MIRSFKCKNTEKLFNDYPVKQFRAFERVARRKLEMLEAAEVLGDLKSPPGNKLEALKKDRIGQHSIRINDQFRICFVWKNGAAYEVEIADYH